MVGATVTFAASAVDASGGAAATTFTWTSSATSVATVDANGVATGVANGVATITATAANGVAGTAKLSVTTPATVVNHAGDVVISQIYGGGGNGGSVYKNDFVELFNRSAQPVNVSGWSVQYASATGAFTQATPLSGLIPAGGYYLVQEGAGTGGTTDLPTPEATGTINMSATAGKILLVQSATPAGAVCPTGTTVVDQVSFGSGTNCGTFTPTLSATLSAQRRSGGCFYTPNAASDFIADAPAPRNGVTAPRSCVVGPLDHVTLTGSLGILAGATTQLTATPLDANDNNVTSATLTWASSDASIATVNSTGLVTGVAANADPATITVTAVAGGITKTASVAVQVNTDGINWIDISSSSASFPPGFQTQMFATARVQSGGAIIPANFVFEAVDPQYATVQTVQNTAIVTGVAAPTDGSRPGIRITATPTAGGTPFVFVTHPITIEAPSSAPTTVYANNDEFGDPTPVSPTNANDFLIRRAQYVLSYNQSHGTPNWVSYELDGRQLVSGQDRCNCFTADPTLPADKQIFTSDYTNGGFDRGHMTRSADRTLANVDNAITFYLSNVVPQQADLNQGVWAQFENALADSARAGRAVYIITGPLYSRSHALSFVKNEGKIAIPDSTWKIALIGPANSGNPFTRANVQSFNDLTGLTLLAVNMPNIAGVRNDPWAKYLTTVDKIETATGFDFLSLLQANFQPALDYKDHAPAAHFTTSGGTAEGLAVTFDASTSVDPDTARTDLGRTEALSYAWHFSDGSDAAGKVVTKMFGHGTITATLTVTDAFGWPNSITSTIALANTAPTATFAAPPSGLEGGTFTLSLTNATDASPADAAALRFSFDCGSGYGSPSTTSTATCTIADQGEVTVRGKVIDPGDAFTEYSAIINVTNVAPTATFSAPATAARGGTITLSLSGASDPSSADVAAGFSYAFDCGAGTGYAAASTSSTASCTLAQGGTRTVRGKISDKDGGVSEYSSPVVVSSTPPTATFAAPASGLEGAAFALTLSNATSSSSSDALRFAFDCGAGYGSTSSASTASCTPVDQGDVNVRAKVIDPVDLFTEYTAVVHVTNVAPHATFAAPPSVGRGSAISLALTGVSDPSSADVAAGFTYAFDCGAGAGYGAASAAATASCPTTASGSRTVRGRVSDKDGGITEYSSTVAVTSVPPTATFAAPASDTAGTTFTLSLTAPTAATPADLAALRYAFDCGVGYGAVGTTATASCTPGAAGTTNVRGKVIDLEGAFTEYSGAVRVIPVTVALVRRAPTLNARLEGSLQMLSGENVTFNGGSAITGKLYVPGLPTVRLNGNPQVGGTVDATGSASPSGYTVTLNGGSSLGTLVRRTDPGTLPVVAAPVAPSGTRSVNLNNATDVVGDWSTVRNLTLNGAVSPLTVPQGAYADLTVNGSNKIVLGVAGATTPSVYNFQHLTLNGQASVQVVGPVIVTVGNSVSLNGSVGAASNPEWLTFKISQGGLTLNSNVAVAGVVLVPNGTVTINGGSSITGALAADGLVLNGNALAKITMPVP